ncbi:MAG: hypothetical protein R3B72_49695 [Polyangiaceae bacterium]
MSDSPEDAQEARLVAKARELVDEALAPYQGALSAEEIEMMRAIMASELLVEPQGRAHLLRIVGAAPPKSPSQT